MSEPTTPPLITQARLKVVGRLRRRVWDLYADGLLVGWTSADPAGGDASNFRPSCWGYGSGQHLSVRYSPTLTIA